MIKLCHVPKKITILFLMQILFKSIGLSIKSKKYLGKFSDYIFEKGILKTLKFRG